MAKAKKLPSGAWRCLAYSHTEKVLDPKTGKMKDKRIYESFTADTRAEAEFAASEFQLNKSKTNLSKRREMAHKTLKEAATMYIEMCETLNRSPTTTQDYRCILKNGFQDLWDIPLKDINADLLQDAIIAEAQRQANNRDRKTISAKRLKNEWGLLTAVLHKYRKDLDLDDIQLPTVTRRMVELPPARQVLEIIRGTEIELPVLLAAWLSFTMSEIKGLTKSQSVNGDYLTIRSVVVNTSDGPYRKELAKNETRNRRHRIPVYIKELIDRVPGDEIVPMSSSALYHKWIRLQKKHSMDPITFHDLRHLNASVMALLRIPDKYAQERGGWKSDKVMKGIYMQTFSEERVKVDDIMDTYFNEIMQHEMQHEKEKAL